jgi:glucose-6-phosphate 1-epimerase
MVKIEGGRKSVFLFQFLEKNVMLDKTKLDSQLAINNEVSFQQAQGDLTMIDIDNQYATAAISLYGGQVLSYIPKNQTKDVLFSSDKAKHDVGKAIRGGIPICWPWFGDDTSVFGRPAHGFARNLPWKKLNTIHNKDGSTSVKLRLSNTEETLAIWPHEFELIVDITIGEQLTVALTTKNNDTRDIVISQALHSYFNVGDISQVSVSGLDEINYLDKLESYLLQQQKGDVVIEQEVDRIYQNTPQEVTLVDKSLNRTISVSSQASNSIVVWNPWQENCAKFSDLSADDYQHFLCIENANVFDDSVTIAAGKSHTLTAVFKVENN